MARVVVIALLALAASANASPNRSTAARAEFQRLTPCPVNGAKRGACPGHVVDHIEPLCAGGLDHHSNMQWQTVDDAKAKDRLERLQCRKKASPALPGG